MSRRGKVLLSWEDIDGAGFSHGLIDHIAELNTRPGHRVHYSAGWDLGGRNAPLSPRPARAWGQVLDATGRSSAGGGSRTPAAQLSLFEEADGWRYQPHRDQYPR